MRKETREGSQAVGERPASGLETTLVLGESGLWQGKGVSFEDTAVTSIPWH